MTYKEVITMYFFKKKMGTRNLYILTITGLQILEQPLGTIINSSIAQIINLGDKSKHLLKIKPITAFTLISTPKPFVECDETCIDY